MVLLKSFNKWVRQATANISTFHYGSIKMIMDIVKDKLLNKSTFHYGSIKIGMEILNILLSKQSTFHYGSIKIYIINQVMGKF